MRFKRACPIVDLKYVLASRRHKNEISDVLDVTELVKAILTSLATSY